MTGPDEDDKPTVVLDLNALKNMKLKQEEDLANIATELEFNVIPEEIPGPTIAKDSNFPVILFDFGADMFEASTTLFPEGFSYKIIKTLPELNVSLLCLTKLFAAGYLFFSTY